MSLTSGRNPSIVLGGKRRKKRKKHGRTHKT